jgi:hypothetical protein
MSKRGLATWPLNQMDLDSKPGSSTDLLYELCLFVNLLRLSLLFCKLGTHCSSYRAKARIIENMYTKINIMPCPRYITLEEDNYAHTLKETIHHD